MIQQHIQCTIETRVTIEDGVYSLVIEVKIEYMFDNGKGRIWYERLKFFLNSCGYAGEFGGVEDEQVNQDLEGRE